MKQAKACRNGIAIFQLKFMSVFMTREVRFNNMELENQRDAQE